MSNWSKIVGEGNLNLYSSVSSDAAPNGTCCSPDGKHVYSVSTVSTSTYVYTTYVTIFSSNGISLTNIGTRLIPNTTAATWAVFSKICISPDGNHVYVWGPNGILWQCLRDPITGLLTFLSPNYLTVGASGTYKMGSMVMSADGTSLYCTLYAQVFNSGATYLNTVILFTRNPLTGLCTLGSHWSTTTNTETDIAISPDGLSVFTGKLAYARDAATGSLTVVQSTELLAYSLLNMCMTPDGTLLICSTGRVFRRDTTTGLIAFINMWAFVTAASFLTTSLDGKYLYVVSTTFNLIYTYAIDYATGGRTLVGSVTTDAYPVSISACSDGSTFFSANRTAATVSAFSMTKSPGVSQIQGNVVYQPTLVCTAKLKRIGNSSSQQCKTAQGKMSLKPRTTGQRISVRTKSWKLVVNKSIWNPI